MIQSIDREIENQTKTLINHKVFKAKLKQKELFTYKSDEPGLSVCPAILQVVLFSLCAESPRYLLITANREEEARKGTSFRVLFVLSAFVLEFLNDAPKLVPWRSRE